jgi:hypothetical protein
MSTSLPTGDECAMNFEDVGVFFCTFCCFPQHLCDLGANFAENVASRPSGPKPRRAGPIAKGCTPCECIYDPRNAS